MSAELSAIKDEIREHARDYGLDFFETYFELLDFDQVNEVASYGGFPTRYPHWRFGMQYEEMMKGYSYGLSKIYELVINNDPCYAYLMKSNSLVDQKIVIAHVYGHSDFFKNNLWFAGTNRKMMDQMANHGTRVRKMIDRYGLERVETFLDACLSLENLTDPHSVAIRRSRDVSEEEIERDEIEAPARVRKLEAKEYMDSYINPPEYLEAQRKKLAAEVQRKKRFPPEPVRDVLRFLVKHASVASWERDLLAMVREEAYYFGPQAMTKVMNEGWACLTGDARVFTDRGLIPIREMVDDPVDRQVSDGDTTRRVTDRARFADRETVKVTTRRGYEVEGSTTHRVLLADGSWRALQKIRKGDRLRLSKGIELWPSRPEPERVPRQRSAARPSGRRVPAHMTATAQRLMTTTRAVVRAQEEAARTGLLPEAILRSDREVVRMFLAGYFEDAGEAREDSFVLPRLSPDTGRLIQLLLLNFSILSTREGTSDGACRLRVDGTSLRSLRDLLEPCMAQKGFALDVLVHEVEVAYEEPFDEVVSIERGRADVYDITVAETHRYAAEGFVNHNSYWHSRIMTEKALTDAEVVDYADHHAGTLGVRPGVINPYKLGIELFRDIEDRWNRGKFGREWEEEDDYERKKAWDTGTGRGRQKIFEVRKIYNDVTFLDTFLTEEFCEAQKLFVYRVNPRTGQMEIADRDWRKVKEELLFAFTNRGQPIIEVLDGNHRNRGELYLIHRYSGVDLRLDYAQETLKNLHRIWGRPVHIETVVEGKGQVHSFDGERHSVEEMTPTGA